MSVCVSVCVCVCVCVCVFWHSVCVVLTQCGLAESVVLTVCSFWV